MGHSSSNSKWESNSKHLDKNLNHNPKSQITLHNFHIVDYQKSTHQSKSKAEKKLCKMANFHGHRIMNVLMFKLLASAILLSLSLFLTLSFFFTSHSHAFHLHHLVSLPSLSLDLDFFPQETIRFLCIYFFNKQFFFFQILV